MINPIFLLFGNGPYTNLGCEAILRSTVLILEKEFGSLSFINAALTSVPLESLVINEIKLSEKITNHIASDIPRDSLKGIWRRIQRRLKLPIHFEFEKYISQAKVALAAGGDNYSLDYGVPNLFFSANRAVYRHKIPLVLWGASVGPFNANPDYEKFAAKELNKVSLICARESLTVEYLQKIGVDHNVALVADPAFILPTEEISPLQAELSFLSQPSIGLNLSPLLAKYLTGGQWFELAKTCLTELLRSVDLPVVLIPHVICTHTNDYVFLKKIYDSLPEHHHRLFLIDPGYNCCQMKWIISKMILFIGARTHSTIASLSSCVPTLSLGYSMKAKGINRDIFGHCDWVLAVDQIEPFKFVSSVKDLINSRAVVSQYLSGMMDGYKQKAWNSAKLLRKVMN